MVVGVLSGWKKWEKRMRIRSCLVEGLLLLMLMAMAMKAGRWRRGACGLESLAGEVVVLLALVSVLLVVENDCGCLTSCLWPLRTMAAARRLAGRRGDGHGRRHDYACS